LKRFISALLIVSFCAGVLLAADSKSPRVTTVEPDTGKVGDVATAKGENLDKDVVADLYLTDGKNDVKVVIMERAADSIKFKVPQIQAGRYRLMTGSKTAMIEQPVVFEVSEP
jgi:NMD protein affecting ribosome stability and mRNA decay